jgi:hypothetical protein
LLSLLNHISASSLVVSHFTQEQQKVDWLSRCLRKRKIGRMYEL